MLLSHTVHVQYKHHDVIWNCGIAVPNLHWDKHGRHFSEVCVYVRKWYIYVFVWNCKKMASLFGRILLKNFVLLGSFASNLHIRVEWESSRIGFQSPVVIHIVRSHSLYCIYVHTYNYHISSTHCSTNLAGAKRWTIMCKCTLHT